MSERKMIYLCLAHMSEDGMTEFVECGPGQVLTGLIGRIQKSMEQ